MSAKVELRGRPVGVPEFRTTPGGLAVLRLRLHCGRESGNLVIDVVVKGEPARELAGRWEDNRELSVTGTLFARTGLATQRCSVEVVADLVTPTAARPANSHCTGVSAATRWTEKQRP